MIPQRDLSLLSNRLAKSGGRRIPETVLERDYCLAWFLAALSQEKLGERLAFKGGTAIKRCYVGDYRFSEDLDFTLTEETPFEDIRQGLEPVFARVHSASGIMFRFSREDRQAHSNSHTFCLGYEGPLPATAAGKEVKVDITIREKIVFPVERRPVLRGYEEYADLPEGTALRVYSLDEIAVEKTVAVMDRARNEPRDLYDIWYLAEEAHVDLDHLKGAVEEKLGFRGKKLDDVRGEFAAKEARFKKLWQIRLAAQLASLPEFDEVYRAVRRSFRQAGLS
ncbi:MAG TPA: nucleotidyl transferase AbiEii/AbiGii toxin family protein [Elusimicrobia bacterium]|nr:nucleotidyl transferase AbiEii/AbiGii toxin family protein [Elusimicrobiota bacterium]